MRKRSFEGEAFSKVPTAADSFEESVIEEGGGGFQIGQTEDITLESFLSRYSSCASDKIKQLSLQAAISVLAHPPGRAEAHLTLKAIADHYEIAYTTAWRWQFPWRDRFGQKRYSISDCDRYLASDSFKARLSDLRNQRLAMRSQKSRRAS